MTLYFKEEGFLATHPPSCLPWRVFGYPESERKEEKLEKEWEEQKASRPKSLLVSKKVSGYSVCLGLYTAPKQYKLPKSTRTVNCYKDKMGRNQKRNKKAKIQMGSRNSVAGLKSEQLPGEVVSQPTKFYRLQNFHNPTKFMQLPNFLAFSALLFFWFLICNAEFDSNSLCLDRLNNFGINSLQKLQN